MCKNGSPSTHNVKPEKLEALISLFSQETLICNACTEGSEADLDQFVYRVLTSPELCVFKGIVKGILSMVGGQNHNPMEMQINAIATKVAATNFSSSSSSSSSSLSSSGKRSRSSVEREEENCGNSSNSSSSSSSRKRTVKRLVASVSRVFVSTVCAARHWPNSLERAHGPNGGVDRGPSPVGGLNGGSDGSKSDALLCRLSSRSSSIFNMFPGPAAVHLAQYARDVMETLVISPTSFKSAEEDHDMLFSTLSTFSVVLANDQHLTPKSSWCTEPSMTHSVRDLLGTNPSLAKSVEVVHMLSKVGPSSAAVFSRIVASLTFVLKGLVAQQTSKHMQQQHMQQQHMQQKQKKTQKTKATMYKEKQIKKVVVEIRQILMQAYKWCDKEMQNVSMLFEDGKKNVQELCGGRPMKTTRSTFSSNHVVLNLLRNTEKKPMFNASLPRNQTLAHVAASLCSLAKVMRLGTMQHSQNGALMNWSNAVEWHRMEALQIIAQAHWKILRGEPGLCCMNMPSLPVHFVTKLETFKDVLLDRRGQIFAGRGGSAADLVMDLRVDRSSLIPTSMRELLKHFVLHDFPFFRRKVGTLRVTFMREQGSGPGVTRGWFASVANAIQTMDERVLQRIGGGQASPLAPTYMMKQSTVSNISSSTRLEEAKQIIGLEEAKQIIENYELSKITLQNERAKVSKVVHDELAKLLPRNVIATALQIARKERESNENSENSEERSQHQPSSSVTGLPNMSKCEGEGGYASVEECKLILELCTFVGRFIGLAISHEERIPLTLCPHVARYVQN